MEDKSRSSVERAKCQGIHGKMTQWLFLVEMALVKDALETLQALSLFLQRRDATAVSANAEVGVAVRTLRSMRQADGVNVRGLKEEFESFHSFKGVNVSQPSDSDHRKAEVFRERPTTLSTGWMTMELFLMQLFLIRQIGHLMKMSASYMETTNFSPFRRLLLMRLQPVLLKEFHQFKCHGITGDNLRKVLITVSTLPVFIEK